MPEREATIWFNGACVRASQACLPVLDHAVQYGAGLFETFRTWQGCAPFLSRHLARLRQGCGQYRIRPAAGALLPHAERTMPAILHELLARNGCADGVFRYTVTAGEAPPGLPQGPYHQPAEIITVRPLPAEPAGGWRLHVLGTRRLTPEFLPRPKSLQYANGLAARWEMLDRGLPTDAEGLMATAAGFVAEGVTSNVFFQLGGELCTPGLDLGVLPGVMRGLVLEWAGAADIPVREGTFPVAALADTGMAIRTSGAIGIAPVMQVFDEAGRLLAAPATVNHPWFRRLRARLQQELNANGESAGPGRGLLHPDASAN